MSLREQLPTLSRFRDWLLRRLGRRDGAYSPALPARRELIRLLEQMLEATESLRVEMNRRQQELRNEITDKK